MCVFVCSHVSLASGDNDEDYVRDNAQGEGLQLEAKKPKPSRQRAQKAPSVGFCAQFYIASVSACVHMCVASSCVCVFYDMAAAPHGWLAMLSIPHWSLPMPQFNSQFRAPFTVPLSPLPALHSPFPRFSSCLRSGSCSHVRVENKRLNSLSNGQNYLMRWVLGGWLQLYSSDYGGQAGALRPTLREWAWVYMYIYVLVCVCETVYVCVKRVIASGKQTPPAASCVDIGHRADGRRRPLAASRPSTAVNPPAAIAMRIHCHCLSLSVWLCACECVFNGCRNGCPLLCISISFKLSSFESFLLTISKNMGECYAN